MKNMKGQVVLNLPAKKAWEMYRNNEIISKINPQILAHTEYVQGDGSPGSLRLFKLGPAVHSYVKESMEKIENVEKGRSVTYRVVDGELMSLYDPYRVTFSFIPMEGKEKTRCVSLNGKQNSSHGLLQLLHQKRPGKLHLDFSNGLTSAN